MWGVGMICGGRRSNVRSVGNEWNLQLLKMSEFLLGEISGACSRSFGSI